MSPDWSRVVETKTSAQQKLQSKNAAKEYRFGSPKLRDLLREKCRLRARDARHKHFDNMRSDQKAKNATYNLILREEIANLEADHVLQEEIYKELMDEVNDWFVEQLLEENNFLMSIAESDEIFCPTCQKHVLSNHSNETETTAQLYKCNCGIQFYFAGGHEELRLAINDVMNEHEKLCAHTLKFIEMPDTCLSAICDKCHFFSGMHIANE